MVQQLGILVSIEEPNLTVMSSVVCHIVSCLWCQVSNHVDVKMSHVISWSFSKSRVSNWILWKCPPLDKRQCVENSRDKKCRVALSRVSIFTRVPSRPLHFTSYLVFWNFMSILFLSNNAEIVLTGEGAVLWICTLMIKPNIVLSSNNDLHCLSECSLIILLLTLISSEQSRPSLYYEYSQSH